MSQTYRVVKNKNYTIMSNYHLKDKSLSLKAKGLLSFMLSLPDGWIFTIKGLVSVCKEQTKAIRSGLKELEEHNYLIREKKQGIKGQFNYDYSIYEVPYTHFGHTENGYSPKELQINTKEININNIDKKDKQNNIFVQELIKLNFVDKNELDIYRYNEFFNNLSNKYNFSILIKAFNYTLKRIKLNRGLDENGYKIEDKFAYLQISLANNLIKLTEETSDSLWN